MIDKAIKYWGNLADYICRAIIYLDLNHLSQTEHQIVYHNKLYDLLQDYIQYDKFPMRHMMLA